MVAVCRLGKTSLALVWLKVTCEELRGISTECSTKIRENDSPYIHAGALRQDTSFVDPPELHPASLAGPHPSLPSMNGTTAQNSEGGSIAYV